MKRLTKSLASLFLLSTLLVSAAPSANAAGACFCNITNQGATQVAGATDAASCQTVCQGQARSEGYRWAADASQYPSSLLQCFSKKEICETDMDGDGTDDGKFDSRQPAECPSGWHYCYPVDSSKYTLQVSIPNGNSSVTSVSNFGEYIGTAYNYLLGFAFTVAIVFVMIGGIRYVIGASSGEIGKAKEMIQKSVSGTVLLLFAVLILQTVNPQLIKLQVPRLPMLRRVEILTGGETCDALENAGYTLDTANATKGKYGTELCGSVATVTLNPDKSPAPEGTTCMYSLCGGHYETGANGAATCVSDGKTGWCLTCNQVVPNNPYNSIPSSSLCGSLDPSDTYVGSTNAYDLYNFCGYTHEPSMVSSGLGATTAAAATAIAAGVSGGVAGGVVAAGYSASVAADALTGTCASLSIDCKQVANCEGYNSAKLQVKNTITDNELYDLDYPSLGDPNIVDICNTDPCQAGQKTTPFQTCLYNADTGDCRTDDYKASK